MKLILASQGFTTPQIAEAVEATVGKPLEKIKIAIINEAYVAIPAEKDKRWLINELSLISNYIGGTIDFINLRTCCKEEVEKRLSLVDMIYIVGGKQLILEKLFKETGFDELLKEFAKTKVVMGTSAGAIVLGKQIEKEEYWEKRQKIAYQKIEDKTLGLVNFNIIPHYLREDRKVWDKEFYCTVLKDNPFPVYAITDTQAIIYENGDITFVGGMPKEIFE